MIHMNERTLRMHETNRKNMVCLIVSRIGRLAKHCLLACLFRRTSRLDARCDLFRSTRRLDDRGVESWFPGIK